MESVDLPTYEIKMTTYKISNRQFGESSYNVTVRNSRPLLPSIAFRAIMKSNPQGNYIRRIK